MDLFDLQKAIKTNKLPKLLVFYGNEYEIMNLYINEICKRYNLSKLIVDSINSAFIKSKGLSIVKANCLYISKYEKEFINNDKNWSNLDKLNSNYAILIQSSIDNRTKFHKQFEQVEIEFKEQKPEMLKTMLNNQHNLCDKAIERLMKNCSYNYSRCLKELYKIKSLSDVNNCTQDEAYKQLISERVIQEDVSIEIPEFIQAVLTKNKNAIVLYNKLIANGVSNIILISWLYNAVKNQLLVQGTAKPTTETTGINYYFIQECFSRMNYYSTKELINFLILLKSCEQGLKSGRFEEQIILDYILVNCIGGVNCIPNV